MKTGDAVVLVMKKCLSLEGVLDEKKYACKVIQYDARQEVIYLALEKDSLEIISLDAIYECNIKEEQDIILCSGRIVERYCNEYGKILKFEIKNGFYKINVKTVDK